MSPWNKELIDLLPSSCKIYASAGAGFDWVDTEALAKRGVVYCNAGAACKLLRRGWGEWVTIFSRPPSLASDEEMLTSLTFRHRKCGGHGDLVDLEHFSGFHIFCYCGEDL